MEAALTAEPPRAGTRRRGRLAVEWPTLALAVAVYAGWAAVTALHQLLPLWALVGLGAPLVALHSSLQHEMLHGHPTRSARVNLWLAAPGLSLWIPYQIYRTTHLRHHRDERLTDPLDDPESHYWTAARWQRLGWPGRAVARLNGTLAGRLLLGPAWIVGRFLAGEVRRLAAGDRRARRAWRAHAIHTAPVLAWLVLVARMDLATYALAIVYPATSLLLIRSFAEHRARAGVAERTAVVERAWLLGPLFLFNNLHAAHHARPDLPWYRLPGWYRAHRAELVAANGGLVYRDYLEVARRFLLRPHDVPVHPLGRAPLADGRLPGPQG